jgi:hypothetical protein
MAVSHTPLLVQIVRHPASTAVRRPPDRGEAEEIVAVTPVRADHLMAKARQVSRYVDTHVTALPGNQNPHGPNHPAASAQASDFHNRERHHVSAGHPSDRRDARD